MYVIKHVCNKTQYKNCLCGVIRIYTYITIEKLLTSDAAFTTPNELDFIYTITAIKDNARLGARTKYPNSFLSNSSVLRVHMKWVVI